MASKVNEAKERDLVQLRGVSDKRARLLNKLGLRRIGDLVFFYPRSYDDWSETPGLMGVSDGEMITVKAQIVGEGQLQRKGKLSWLRLPLETSEGIVIQATWFNQSWLKSKFHIGQVFYFHGKLDRKSYRYQLVNPLHLTEEEYKDQSILPIYPLTAGLNQGLMRKLTSQALDLFSDQLSDPLPEMVRKEEKLAGLAFSLREIHFPTSPKTLGLARDRLAFEELFLLRIAMLQRKLARKSSQRARALQTSQQAREGIDALRKSLPFSLTKGQLTAINDILRDLRKVEPMNRLIQGDVGSGKTLVAAFAMAYTAWCGGQSIFMAPTSILANQHFQSLTKLFQGFDLHIALLTGASKSQERREILQKCRAGKVDILIGTHALLQEDVVLKDPVLAITDEQHRFGVNQRAKLSQDQQRQIHHLVMSATPIPRSLGLILYGDLDLSVIREMPAGRQVTKTRLCPSPALASIYRDMGERLQKGEQAYVVCPLLADSDQLNLASAEEVFRSLAEEVFPNYRVALVHGQLKQQDKDQIMADFLDGHIQVLVATTVIEVGVDNPNANFMLIRNAECFGLAQLHQLRGRVGRGQIAAECVLLSDSQDPLALARLNALVASNDGFALANEDLKLRGPGDFFGTRQHGLPAFKLVNLYEDQALIQRVEASIDSLLNQDPQLDNIPTIDRALADRYPDFEEGLVL